MSDAKYIMRMNSLRNEAAHEGNFRGSYQDVAAYADFVKRWLGSTLFIGYYGNLQS